VLEDFIDSQVVGNVAAHEVISGILCDLNVVGRDRSAPRISQVR
jgi:hypothetical protein